MTVGYGVLLVKPHLAEDADGDPSVFRDRRLLLRGPHIDLRLQEAAEKGRLQQPRTDAGDRVVATLQLEELGGDRRQAPDQGDPRQPCRLGLFAQVEGGGDAALGGDDVGSPLEQFRGQAYRKGARPRRQLRGDGDGRGRVAPEQRFERAQRVARGKIEMADAIAQRLGVGLRQR